MDSAISHGRTSLVRAAAVLAGLALPQVLLFHASLTGSRLLLPLGLLALSNVYLPGTPEYQDIAIPSDVLSDEVLLGEPMRRFAAEEIRHGRLPLWNPYSFAGAPLANLSFLSPFFWVSCCFPS